MHESVFFIQVRSQVGTIIYRAPEILHNRTYTEKVDMWALGCTMHSCLTHTLRSINVEAYSNPNLMQEVTDELKKGGMCDLAKGTPFPSCCWREWMPASQNCE